MWALLLVAADCYYWWFTRGDWIQRTEPFLFTRDAVRFGPVSMAFVYGWLAAFLVVSGISLGR